MKRQAIDNICRNSSQSFVRTFLSNEISTEDSAQQIRYKTSAEKGRYSGYISDSADESPDIAYAKNIILIYGVRTNSHRLLHKMLLNLEQKYDNIILYTRITPDKTGNLPFLQRY